MKTPGKTDPAIYPRLRDKALKIRLPNLPPGSVHAVLMDLNVTNGNVTVLAGAEGTASIYLSSGGGFIGGSLGHPAIRDAALHAVKVANALLPFSKEAKASPLPVQSDVFFYFVTGGGLRHASATDAELRAGSSPLNPLGGAMQRITEQ